jgi:hypothetical protein
VTLINNAGALIQSQDDAFRINVGVTAGSIIINNFGTIKSTNGGQGLDFDAIAAGTATVSITNRATGLIQADNNDAIRPGQGALVTNFGTLFTNGSFTGNDGTKNDGIDWQGHSGTVVNKTGALISAFRHGITSDVDVNVTNEVGATIIGRNGSGVGSDGTGTVVNFGTITAPMRATARRTATATASISTWSAPSSTPERSRGPAPAASTAAVSPMAAKASPWAAAPSSTTPAR